MPPFHFVCHIRRLQITKSERSNESHFVFPRTASPSSGRLWHYVYLRLSSYQLEALIRANSNQCSASDLAHRRQSGKKSIDGRHLLHGNNIFFTRLVSSRRQLSKRSISRHGGLHFHSTQPLKKILFGLGIRRWKNAKEYADAANWFPHREYIHFIFVPNFSIK